MKNRDLWKLYPDIWPTQSAFFSWLRGALRRAVWEKYPIKLKVKNKGCSPPPKGYTGRAKSGANCALTGEWTGKSLLEVDHIEGNASLRSWEDVLPFIQHLCATEEELQLVSKEAHKTKSYAERMGISFEEAVLEKQVITFKKLPVEEQKSLLTSLGFDATLLSNKALREDCYRTYLKEKA